MKAARFSETSVTKRPLVRTSDPRKFQSSIQTRAGRNGVFMYNLLNDAVDSWDYTALNDILIDPFYPKRSTELLHNTTDSRVLIQKGSAICCSNQKKSMDKIYCAKGKNEESVDRTSQCLLSYCLAIGKHVSSTMNPIEWDVTLQKICHWPNSLANWMNAESNCLSHISISFGDSRGNNFE